MSLECLIFFSFNACCRKFTFQGLKTWCNVNTSFNLNADQDFEHLHDSTVLLCPMVCIPTLHVYLKPFKSGRGWFHLIKRRIVLVSWSPYQKAFSFQLVFMVGWYLIPIIVVFSPIRCVSVFFSSFFLIGDDRFFHLWLLVRVW